MLQQQKLKSSALFHLSGGMSWQEPSPYSALYSALAVSRAERTAVDQGTKHAASKDILLATASEATA